MPPLVPYARQDGLVVTDLPDETLVYDLQRHKAHCLNRTAALVWRACDGQTSIANLAARIQLELGEPVTEDVVWLALDRLGQAHLLQERVSPPALLMGMSRREFLRKAAVASAVALPVVASLTAPRAAQAASCNASTGRNLGCQCDTNAQCAPNCCHKNSKTCVTPGGNNCGTTKQDTQPEVAPTSPGLRRDLGQPKPLAEPTKVPAKPATQPTKAPIKKP